MTALFFLYLTFHEAQATEEHKAARAANQARGVEGHQGGVLEPSLNSAKPSLSSTKASLNPTRPPLNSTRTVFATVWGQTLAQDGTGFYNELADMLLRHESAAVSYQLMPYKRAKARFLDHAGSCLYPSAIGVLDAGDHIKDPDNFIETFPLFTTKTHLFARTGETPPRSMGELYGKTIAVPSGSVMQSVLKGTGATLIGVHDEVDKAHMLLTGRVDYMTAMLPDAVLVFAAMGKPLPEFDPAMPFLEAGVSLVCHRTRENAALIETLNLRIAELSTNPTYRTKLFEAGIWRENVAGDDLGALMPEGGSEGMPVGMPVGGALEAVALQKYTDEDKVAAKAPIAHAVKGPVPTTP